MDCYFSSKDWVVGLPFKSQEGEQKRSVQLERNELGMSGPLQGRKEWKSCRK